MFHIFKFIITHFVNLNNLFCSNILKFCHKLLDLNFKTEKYFIFYCLIFLIYLRKRFLKEFILIEDDFALL
jgi:hypothetical protein